MVETTLEKFERQYEQAKARLQAARARESEKQRKLEARRKIILGGALIERAARDPQAARMLITLVAGLGRQQDRKTFEGWNLPSPERQSEPNQPEGEPAPGSDPGQGDEASS